MQFVWPGSDPCAPPTAPHGTTERLSHPSGMVGAVTTTWRLKATQGHGWAQRFDPDGSVSVTADPMGAYQWDTRERAERAHASLRAGLVPFQVVGGPAFTRRNPRH